MYFVRIVSAFGGSLVNKLLVTVIIIIISIFIIINIVIIILPLLLMAVSQDGGLGATFMSNNRLFYRFTVNSGMNISIVS